MKNTATFLLLINMLLTGLPVWGQLSSEEIKDVTPAGPFPLYLTLQYAKTSTLSDFKTLCRAINELSSSEVDTKRTLHGLEGNFGVAINERYLSNFYGEVGFRFVNRAHDNEDLTLRLINQTRSFRLGYRKVIFYPITFQGQFGILFFTERSFKFDSLNSVSRISYQRKLFADSGIPGYEARLRLMIADPIGTSGGLGFFFEWRSEWYSRRHSLDPVFRRLGSEVRGLRTDNHNMSFSFGLVAALALRIQ